MSRPPIDVFLRPEPGDRVEILNGDLQWCLHVVGNVDEQGVSGSVYDARLSNDEPAYFTQSRSLWESMLRRPSIYRQTRVFE